METFNVQVSNLSRSIFQLAYNRTDGTATLFSPTRNSFLRYAPDSSWQSSPAPNESRLAIDRTSASEISKFELIVLDAGTVALRTDLKTDAKWLSVRASDGIVYVSTNRDAKEAARFQFERIDYLTSTVDEA